MVAAHPTATLRVSGAARGALVGTLLCALTMIATTWTLLATGWADGAGGALVVAFAAVIEAAVLAYARVPRTVAVLLVPVLALAAIIPATISSLPFDGDTSLPHLFARYAASAFTGLSTTQDWSFTVGLCAVLWISGYWLTWLALREHRGIPAVIPIFVVLVTNVLNAKTGRSPALPTVMALGFSLMVIANAHLDALETRWQKGMVESMPGIRSGMVGSTAIIAVAALIVGSLLPRATTSDISGRFFSGGGSGHAGAGGDSGSGGPAFIGFNGATTPGGPLVSNPTPVLTYTVDTTAPIYLRVVNDTDFNAGNWFPEKSGISFDNGLAFDGIPYHAGTLPRDTDRADGAVASSSFLVTAHVTLKPNATGSTDEAVFPGDPVTVSANGVAYGTVDLGQGGSSLLTVDSVQLATDAHPITTLTTKGTVPTATATQLRAAGTNYPPFTERYTSLPDDATHGAEVIQSLARQWTQGARDPYDQATLIEQHLRSPQFFTYTLSPPSAPQSEWPIVYFLTSSKHGYCQYFASSMGAMLRSLGIPTRLVNGYGPGTTLASGNRPGQRQQQVTTSDAHTWVEAYFPGYGWIPFEPTPSSAQGAYQPISRGLAAVVPPLVPGGAPDVRPGFADPSRAPAARGTSPPPSPGPSGAWIPDLRVIGLSVLGAFGVAAVLLALWLLLPTSQRGAWRRLEVVGRVLGLGRRTDETHRAYAQRFAGAVTSARLRAKHTHGTSSRLGSVVTELAAASATNEFARPGAQTRRAHGVRRLWLHVLRAVPGLALRSLSRRSAVS